MTDQRLPDTGDPFSRAYASQGLSLPTRNGQVSPNGNVPQKLPAQYAGYGLQMPGGQGCPPDPADALVECIKAMQEVLGDTLQLTDFAPWIHPTFRSRAPNDYVQAVLSTTVAFNAATNAAGLALRAANSVAGPLPFAPALIEMASATDWQLLYSLKPPQGQAVRVASWGISAGNVGPKNLAVRVKASTVGGQPTAPNPFLGSHEAKDHQPTFFVLQPEQELRVEVALRDTTSPTLVEFGICYWIFAVNKRVDTREGLRLRPGYGVDCK